MKNFTKHIGLCGLAMLPMAMQAQTINFETQDYKSLGVYDTWVASPFRTGALSGNFAVIDNHLKDADSNNSDKILGIQRSRLGSNTFGVKIDLNETFELTPTVKYCHVMMHKPSAGRVMLIGLGKKTNREDQSTDVEQFWAYPVNDVKSGEWFDAVFPIKGNGGIDIYSLVVVPDCEAPHTLSSDFVAYIDDIVINSSLTPRVGLGDYPVNYSTTSGWGRDDRKVKGLKFNGGADGNQSITIADADLKGYMTLFDTPFLAKAGNTITPLFDYEGSWVHGYVYLDKDRDGQFSYGVDANDNLDTSTDLVSYSAYRTSDSNNFKNSAGSSFSNGNVLNPPSFTIPSGLAPGIYRMRYKVDWNCIDAGGNIAAGNNILSNGGGCFDVLLNIHEDQVSVTQDNRNGEVLVASTGQTINNNRIPFGQDFKIRMNPSNGFEYNGIRVRHGYNLSGDSLVKSNPQYRDIIFTADQFDDDDSFTIPGSVIDGDVLIEGLFVEQGNAKKRTEITYNITFNGKVINTQTYRAYPGAEFPTPSIESEASASYYSLSGMPEGTVPEENVEINLTLIQNLPFEACTEVDEDTVWYTLTLSADQNPLAFSESLSYISLASTSKSNAEAYQWAFVGDVINGFKLVNRAAPGKILSSSTSITSSNDGSVYATLIDEPVADGYNTYWMPTVSNSISGKTGGFYLHQKGFTTHILNKRDARLAYWVGGADGGSTFLVEVVDEDAIPDIDYCVPQPVSGRSVSGSVTKRTDRYVTNISVSDGESSMTVTGGGSTSGRQVYTDRTGNVLNTEPGKTITLNVTGAGYWCNTYIYFDADLNGLDGSDKVFENFTTMPDGGNTLATEATFTLPDNLPGGDYRVRYITNWDDTNDPCVFGTASQDNGEAVIDFVLHVTSYATVSYIVNGDGEIQGWTKLGKSSGRPAADAVAVNDGDQIETGAKTRLGLIFAPAGENNITAIVIENGNNEPISFEADADLFKDVVVNEDSEAYAGAKFYILTPVSGDVTVTASFSDEVQGIIDIFGDDNDAPVEFFNIQGMKIPTENLVPGIYIMRRGEKTAKVYIR